MKSASCGSSDLTGHFVYKYVLNNEIIYVGKTDKSLVSRLNQHGKYGDNIPENAHKELKKSEIYYCKLLSAKLSDLYESELIRQYKPKYNKAKTISWDGIELPKLNWKKYTPPTNNKHPIKNKNFISRKKMTIDILIGERIKIARKKEHLTQQKVASALGLTVKHISSIERGVSRFSYEYLIKYCELVRVSTDYILLGQDKSAEYSDLKYSYDVLSKKYNELLKEIFSLINREDKKYGIN